VNFRAPLRDAGMSAAFSSAARGGTNPPIAVVFGAFLA